MRKRLALLSMMAVLVISFMFPPVGASATELPGNNEESVFDENNVKFAVDIVEKYYRNKDLGEKNDFSNDVSADVLKLLNTKIEMGQLQNPLCQNSCRTPH